MTPGKYNITIRQGDSFAETFTLVAIDWSTYSALMQWRDALGTVKVSCSSPSTLIITHPSTDTILTPIITATQTAALSAGILRYDLQLTSTTGVVTTILEGTVDVVADVTIPVTP